MSDKRTRRSWVDVLDESVKARTVLVIILALLGAGIPFLLEHLLR